MNHFYSIYKRTCAFALLACMYILHVNLLLKIEWGQNFLTIQIFLIIIFIYYTFLYVHKVLGLTPKKIRINNTLRTINILIVAIMLFAIYIANKKTIINPTHEDIFKILFVALIDLLLPELIFHLFSADVSDDNENNDSNNDATEFSI